MHLRAQATRRMGACIAIALLCLPSAAEAHAVYDRSTPNDEETVAAAPTQITIEFTEALLPNDPFTDQPNSFIEFLTPCGEQRSGRDEQIVGKRMTSMIDADGPGRYVVRWYALSAEDGHRSFGDFSFTVSGTAACTPTPPTPSSTPTGQPSATSTRSSERAGAGNAGARPSSRPFEGASIDPRSAATSPIEPTFAAVPRFDAATHRSGWALALLALVLALGAIPITIGRRDP